MLLNLLERLDRNRFSPHVISLTTLGEIGPRIAALGIPVKAMACGTPVVSTDCPSGPAEILQDGKWGRLVPVGDAAALAEAILTTLAETNHPDVARRARDFGVDQAVDGYLRVLLGNEGPRGEKS